MGHTHELKTFMEFGYIPEAVSGHLNFWIDVINVLLWHPGSGMSPYKTAMELPLPSNQYSLGLVET